MEAALKLAFALNFGGLMLAVRRLARRLRQRPDGSVNQMENEMPALKIIRPVLGVVFYLELFDWLLPGTRTAWAYVVLPYPIRWGGAAACWLATAVIWWSFEALGRNYRGGLGLWDDHQLVVEGPYSLVRHPIYGSFVLIMVGAAGMSANWLLGGAGVLLTLAIPALRLKQEEQELRERFGAAYSEYGRATARFVPWLFWSQSVHDT